MVPSKYTPEQIAAMKMRAQNAAVEYLKRSAPLFKILQKKEDQAIADLVAQAVIDPMSIFPK